MSARFLTLAEVGQQPVRWLWPNRIPYGALTLLVGHPGPGKSTLTCDIIARLTAGKAMFNCTGRPNSQGALLLAAEDDLAATIKPRLLAAGAATRRVRVLDCTSGEGLRLPNDLPELERELGDSQAKLLVVDPLMEFIEGNANSNQAMRKALSPLAKLARRTGTAVILVDHLNKSGGGPALNRVAGSVGIAGLVRCILLAAQLPGGIDQSVLAHLKTNLGPLAQSLAFRKVNSAGVPVIEWLGVSEYSAEELTGLTGRNEGSALDEAIRVLFAILGDGKVVAKKAKKMATDAGVTAATLRRAKKALGVVSKREGFGPGSRFFWKLTEENSLVRRLREEETSRLADRLFFGDDVDDDPADWWKKQ